MLFFPKANLAFIAVPKTGSMAAEATLGPFAREVGSPVLKYMHRSATDAANLYGSDVETVALVREPISWVKSKYRYLSGYQIDFGSRYCTRLIGFESFADRILRGQKPWPEPLKTQSAYIQGADHVFQYEQFELFVEFMSNRLGHKISIPSANGSPIVDIKESDAILRKLQEHFREDAATHKAAFRPE